jgi:hypothetical protein
MVQRKISANFGIFGQTDMYDKEADDVFAVPGAACQSGGAVL